MSDATDISPNPEPEKPDIPQFGFDYANLTPINIGSGGSQLQYQDNDGPPVQRTAVEKVLEHYGVDPQQIDQAHARRSWIPTIAGEAHDLVNQAEGSTPSERITRLNNAVRYTEHTWFDTSLRLNEAIKRGDTASAEQLVKHLNQSMQEVYPPPQKDRAKSLMQQEAIDNPRLQALYGSVGVEVESGKELAEELEVKYAPELQEIQAVIEKLYGEIIKEFIPDDGELYSPLKIHVILNLIINHLSQTDSSVSWAAVQAEIAKESHIISTTSENGIVTINVPGKGEDIGALELRGIVSHELLWHAARSANGWSKGKKDAKAGELQGRGMPLYLGFEEGGAIISELAFTGKIEQLFIDRYTDIALASGVLDGRIRSRHELQDFVLERELARRGLSDIEELGKDVVKALRIHVDRIYRGGYGGDNPKLTVIYPKDAEYLAGAYKFVEWYREQREHGFKPEEIYQRAREGKNDLTVSEHVLYLDEIGAA